MTAWDIAALVVAGYLVVLLPGLCLLGRCLGRVADSMTAAVPRNARGRLETQQRNTTTTAT